VIAVLEPGDQLALTTWGSGSCPTVPVALAVVNRHEVRVTLSNAYSGNCTTDYSANTSVLQLDPARVDTATDLRVTLDGIAGLPAVTAHPRVRRPR
jgi:hypothetical protein